MRSINTNSGSYVLIESNAVENLTSFSQSPQRIRKCCPLCDSTRIARRTRKGGYVCSDCLKSFNNPSSKLSTVGGKLPVFLLARPEVQV